MIVSIIYFHIFFSVVFTLSFVIFVIIQLIHILVAMQSNPKYKIENKKCVTNESEELTKLKTGLLRMQSLLTLVHRITKGGKGREESCNIETALLLLNQKKASETIFNDPFEGIYIYIEYFETYSIFIKTITLTFSNMLDMSFFFFSLIWGRGYLFSCIEYFSFIMCSLSCYLVYFVMCNLSFLL